MAGKKTSDGPFLAANEILVCEFCSSELLMGTDQNGMGTETCDRGCFTRPVQTRRHVCPDCGCGPWEAATGCIQCGLGWVTKACDWDGVTAFWITPSAVRGKDVNKPQVVAS